jgi:glycosyltransferase involved in cell wall biosynthesis
MRVLMLHNYYQHAGGEDESFAAEASLLEERGHRVDRWVLHNDSIKDISLPSVGVRTVWNHNLFRALREHIRAHRPDLVHAQNTFPLISPAAYYAAKAEGIPVVQSIHNYRLFCLNGLFWRDGHRCEDCTFKALPWPGVAHRCYRDSTLLSAGVATMIGVHRMLRTWERQIDVFVALTAFGKRKLAALGIPESRIVVKPNFLSTDPGVGEEPIGNYVLFAGRLSPEKGLHTLLQAWSRLKVPIKLKVVGDGPLGGRLREIAAGDHSVEFVGRLSSKETQTLINGAQVVVVPSECYETFGRVIIEAYAAGTPVVASRIGALAELVLDGRTGRLFQPGDPDDLARSIQQLLNKRDLYLQMRRAARQEYLTRYSACVNYELLMDIYASALAGSERRLATP